MTSFDEVASTYLASNQSLPTKYGDLICDTFNIKSKDNILDLGCGSGLLTFELCKFSESVSGVDSSSRLIEVAREMDRGNKIDWNCSTVEEFKIPKEHYSLIISYESFHLFPDQSGLVQRYFHSLRSGGYLCIGWSLHSWEELLKFEIMTVFNQFDIEWGEWSYQSCPSFKNHIESTKLFNTNIREVFISKKREYNLEKIANYLSCIQKAHVLSGSRKKELAEALKIRFKSVLGSNHFRGESKYYLTYVQK